MPRNSKPARSHQVPKGRDRTPRRRRDDYRLSVRGQLRKEPDVGKIARVVIALAMAQAEADAERERIERTGHGAIDPTDAGQAGSSQGEADQ